MDIGKVSKDQIVKMMLNKKISTEEGAKLLGYLDSKKEEKSKPKVYPSDIAVVGMSARFPGAANIYEMWDNLANGVDSVTEIPRDRWDVERYYSSNNKDINKTYCRWGGIIPDMDKFDPLFFNISPREALLMDPNQRLFLEESWKALEDAGYPPEELSGTKCGVFAGVAQIDYMNKLKEAGIELDVQFMTGTYISFIPARISYFLNLLGPNEAIDTACSASLVSIHRACRSIIGGECDMAVAGGVNVFTTPQLYIMTARGGMLSREGRCKAFDESADGFVPSEGVCAFVLKSLAKAIEDKDNIYGVIKGSAENQDGKTNGITAPSASSQARLEMQVYETFGIDPSDISYVEAHGTGTKLGDPIEVTALTNAFRKYTQKKQYCAIGSVKTNIGHALAAAGGAGLLKVLLCMKNKKLVPSLHIKKENAHINFADSPFYVNIELKDWEASNGKPRLAAISAFGLSGTNCHMLVQEYV